MIMQNILYCNMKNERHTIKAHILVFLQMMSLLCLIITTKLQKINIYAVLMAIVSLIIALLAFYQMRKSVFSVSPIPNKKAQLLQKGIYGIIRHPMYTAVMLFALACLMQTFTYLRLAIIVELFVVLCVKLLWEEKLLLQHFSAYQQYIKTTKRLIPFVW